MYIDFDGPGGGSRRRVVVVAVAAAVGLVKGVVTASQTTRSVAKREVGVPTLAPPPPPPLSSSILSLALPSCCECVRDGDRNGDDGD